MEEEKFDNIIDLFIFVLETCSGMEFALIETTFSNGFLYTNHEYNGEPYRPNFTGSILQLCLTVYHNFDIEKIYYADHILYEQFGIHINKLEIYDNITSMKDGWLDKMPLKVLKLPNSLRVVPILPDSIENVGKEYFIFMQSLSKYLVKKYKDIYDVDFVDMTFRYDRIPDFECKRLDKTRYSPYNRFIKRYPNKRAALDDITNGTIPLSY